MVQVGTGVRPEYPALGIAGESMKPWLNMASRGKTLLDLGHVNWRELSELCVRPVKCLGTR